MLGSFLGRLLLFIVLAYVCGLLSFSGLNEFVRNQFMDPLTVLEGENAQRALERQLGLTMPNSAQGFYRANQGDATYWMRVTVNRNEVNRVISGSNFLTCGFPVQANYRPVFQFPLLLTPDEQARASWWNPASAQVYSGAECTGTNYRIFRLLVDQSDSTLWTLYLEVVQL